MRKFVQIKTDTRFNVYVNRKFVQDKPWLCECVRCIFSSPLFPFINLCEKTYVSVSYFHWNDFGVCIQPSNIIKLIIDSIGKSSVFQLEDWSYVCMHTIYAFLFVINCILFSYKIFISALCTSLQTAGNVGHHIRLYHRNVTTS